MTLAVRILAAFAAILVIFASWPGIDLWFAGHFWKAADASFVGRPERVDAIRYLIWHLSILLAIASLGAWLASTLVRGRARIPPRLWAFPVLLYALGPGLLVDGVLKRHWGRARPAEVVEFGGTARFTPPFEMAHECARNCSFVSGEAAAAAALAISVGVLVWPHLAPSSRRPVAVGLVLLAVLGGGLRVAAGRHFLSDVIFAAFFVAFIALGLYRLLDLRSAGGAATLPNLRHDLRLVSRSATIRLRRLALRPSQGGGARL